MASTAFGPLVEPGWPDLSHGSPDIGGAFMKGMALTAEIGRRRQQLENQLQSYALRAQQMEFNQQMQEKKFELAQTNQELMNNVRLSRLELDKEKANNSASHWFDMAQIAKEREQRLSDTFTDKLEQRKKVEEAAGALQLIPSQVEAENPGLVRGSDEYLAKIRERSAPYVAQLPTSSRNAWDRQLLNAHNTERNYQLKALESDEKAFKASFARELQAGQDLNIDYDKILNPDKLPAFTTSTGWGPWKQTTETKDKKITVIDPATNQPTDRQVSMTTLNDFKRRYQDLQRRRKNIGTLIDRQDIGVHGAQPWPSNGRAGLQPGVTYFKPDGSGQAGLWTGTEFVIP